MTAAITPHVGIMTEIMAETPPLVEMTGEILAENLASVETNLPIMGVSHDLTAKSVHRVGKNLLIVTESHPLVGIESATMEINQPSVEIIKTSTAAGG